MTHKLDTLLDESLVLDAASGAAPAAVRVLAACHAELNVEAASRLDTAEATFGALLETSPKAVVSEALLQSTLAALDDQGDDAPAPAYVGQARWSGLPRALHACLSQDQDAGWKDRFGGASEIVLDELCEPGVNVRLIKLKPGSSAPGHSHGGDELTLVLSGAFSDKSGRYGAGDVCHARSGDAHRPRVEGEDDCLCLAVEFGDLRLTNPVLSAAGAVFRTLL